MMDRIWIHIPICRDEKDEGLRVSETVDREEKGEWGKMILIEVCNPPHATRRCLDVYADAKNTLELDEMFANRGD